MIFWEISVGRHFSKPLTLVTSAKTVTSVLETKHKNKDSWFSSEKQCKCNVQRNNIMKKDIIITQSNLIALGWTGNESIVT